MIQIRDERGFRLRRENPGQRSVGDVHVQV